jgi:glycosyltransferase involved in cell wall biosynthesis
MPEISVILPVYNAASYVGEALKSLLNQTFSDFEILVLNDGSGDSSEQVILGFKDERIRYIPSERNQGLIYQLNLGLQAAKGKYIARLDADDIAVPERLFLQHSFMQQHPDVVLSGSYASVIDNQKTILRHALNDDNIRLELLQQNAFIHSTVIYRRDILNKNNIVFNDFFNCAEDYHMWVLLSKYGKLANIPEVLIKYRIHDNQVSSTNKNMLNISANNVRYLQVSNLIGRDLIEEEKELHSSLLFPSANRKEAFEIYQWIQLLRKGNQIKKIYNQEFFETWLNKKYTMLLKERFLWNQNKKSLRDIYRSRVLLNSGLTSREKLSLIINTIK